MSESNEKLLNSMVNALLEHRSMVSMSAEETKAKRHYESLRQRVLDQMNKGTNAEALAQRAYHRGARDMDSRARNRPGDGDMGG